MLTQEQKQTIATDLAGYVAQCKSQNSAAVTLKGVSGTTLSQIHNGKWDKIADTMWFTIDAQIRSQAEGWNGVETRVYNLFTQLLMDAKVHANVLAITADAGTGKTFTAKNFAASNANVYHIVCKEWWSLQAFLTEILRTMGATSKINTNDNSAMFNAIARLLTKQYCPLLIFDEADKLSDKSLYSLISLYNELEDICGIVICATDNLERKINDGRNINKKGYDELFSRFGSRFIKIPKNNKNDITAVCLSNGIEDELAITEIINESEGDLRRVKRKIHALKLEQNG